MASLAENIKKIREAQNLKSVDVAGCIGVDKSAYSKIEGGTRTVSVEELYKMAGLFNLTMEQVVNYDENAPQEVTIEDKTAVEQMRLIAQLDEDDRQVIFKLIEKMLTNKKFRDFFNKNVATL